MQLKRIAKTKEDKSKKKKIKESAKGITLVALH